MTHTTKKFITSYSFDPFSDSRMTIFNLNTKDFEIVSENNCLLFEELQNFYGTRDGLEVLLVETKKDDILCLVEACYDRTYQDKNIIAYDYHLIFEKENLEHIEMIIEAIKNKRVSLETVLAEANEKTFDRNIFGLRNISYSITLSDNFDETEEDSFQKTLSSFGYDAQGKFLGFTA